MIQNETHNMTLTEIKATSTTNFKETIIPFLISSKKANKAFLFVFFNHRKNPKNKNYK